MSPQDLAATNAQLDNRIKALETWRTSATSQIAALQASLAALVTRVTALEQKPTGDTAALEARVTALEQKICPHEDASDRTTFAARLAVLEADHIPE